MSMTKTDAIVAIVVALPALSEDDVRGFLECTDDERALIVQSYKDAGKIPGPDGWQTFISIIRVCADLANLVIPITSAVQGVFGISALL
jgi:hypothetical protein